MSAYTKPPDDPEIKKPDPPKPDIEQPDPEPEIKQPKPDEPELEQPRELPPYEG